MVPKIHAKGSSFKGIANYVLHDKDAQTSERVAWSETINLATRNPDTAWKVMAATSMDQDRLKKEAGIKNTGRKSKNHVQHVTLSWHAEEAKELTRDEQIRAAKWFLREIKADDRQAMIVSHSDEPQPHVHLIINRVSPKDGRILPSSFEKMNSSRWAQKYEEERGKIFCHQRVINNAARKRGEYVRGKKDTARHIYEAQQAVANDNSKKQAILDQHRKKSAAIAKKDREDKARHKKEWLALQEQRKQQLAKLQDQLKASVERSKQKVRDAYRPQWEQQHHVQQADLANFNKNEKTLRGRMQNALKLVQWRELVGRTKHGEKTTLSAAFQVFGDAGQRKLALERQFKRQEQLLKREQTTKLRAAADAAKAKGQKTLSASRPLFERERNGLILKHRLERAKTRADWREHDKKQREAWHELRKEAPVNRLSPYQRRVLEQASGSRSAQRSKPPERDKGDERDR